MRAPQQKWSRRRFLGWGTGAPFSALYAWPLPPGEELVPFADYTPDFRADAQSDHPRVKSLDLRKLTSSVTPAEDFFEFHQTETVRADAGKWRLQVAGLVERPTEFTLDDLLKRSDARDLPATIECSGNTSDPRIMNGLVSNAVWRGVSLPAILNECGVRPQAREVIFLGMDTEQDRKFEAANAEYASPHGWSIYVQDALAPGGILASAMNGKPLPPEHGFPLRLILPGWYGMAQVKWLSRIEITDRRYEGRQMARNYQSLRAVKTAEGSLWLDTSISRNNLKSVVARVTQRSSGGNFMCKISGAAWGGPARIDKVEVQIDGGPWRAASIEQRNGDAAWLIWSTDWPNAAAGHHTVVSRATNSRGEVQPTRDELRRRLVSNREDNAQWPRAIQIGPER